MPNSKHAIIRYQALDKCFRNTGRKYFIEDLVEACRVALVNHTGNNESIQKRQVYDDINFMISENGYNAPIEKDKVGRKVYYFYDDVNFTINNQPLTESEAAELKETLLTLNRFKGLPQFEWVESMITRLEASFQFGEEANQIIEFDQNEYLQGKEYIKDLYHAITNKQALTVTYQSFHAEEPSALEFHPYYLKQYNNRWFVFGQNPNYPNITNLALDRIHNIENRDAIYLETTIDFKEYFEDCIGVTYNEGDKTEKVILKIEATRWPFVQTKPIHGSQRVIQKTDEFTKISLEVVQNNELLNTLLHFGEKIEVLEPVSLRKELKEKVSKLNKIYNCAD